ncbi:MAG TPA: glycosyltransferase [Candidatus Binatia bacterium]|nr:glycosyltransferase [Candidatus Binatia bacterium]
MKISVVVPCYNHERYVASCLAAIDAQDHGEVEVVIVDDGSRDGSWDVISGFRWSRHREVRAVRTENRGAHAAINHGIALSTGAYVAICNSDDRFAPRRLSMLAAALGSSSSRFAFSGVRYIDEHDADVSDRVPFALDLQRKQREIATYPTVGFALVLTNVAISTGNFFFARSLVDDVGWFRPYRYVHDWDFALRALLFTEPVYVPEPLYFYRLHPTNSFTTLELESVAATECPELMRRFMRATITGRWPNRDAPSPRNWPGYFEFFVREHWYQPYLVQWDGLDDVVYRPDSSAVTS